MKACELSRNISYSCTCTPPGGEEQDSHPFTRKMKLSGKQIQTSGSIPRRTAFHFLFCFVLGLFCFFPKRNSTLRRSSFQKFSLHRNASILFLILESVDVVVVVVVVLFSQTRPFFFATKKKSFLKLRDTIGQTSFRRTEGSGRQVVLEPCFSKTDKPTYPQIKCAK